MSTQLQIWQPPDSPSNISLSYLKDKCTASIFKNRGELLAAAALQKLAGYHHR